MGIAFNRSFSFPVVRPACLRAIRRQGVIEDGIWEFSPGLFVPEKQARGEAWLFGFCIQDSYFDTWKGDDTSGRQELRTVISDILRDSKIQSHICSSNPDIEAGVRSKRKREGVCIHHQSRGGRSEDIGPDCRPEIPHRENSRYRKR